MRSQCSRPRVDRAFLRIGIRSCRWRIYKNPVSFSLHSIAGHYIGLRASRDQDVRIPDFRWAYAMPPFTPRIATPVLLAPHRGGVWGNSPSARGPAKGRPKTQPGFHKCALAGLLGFAFAGVFLPSALSTASCAAIELRGRYPTESRRQRAPTMRFSQSRAAHTNPVARQKNHELHLLGFGRACFNQRHSTHWSRPCPRPYPFPANCAARSKSFRCSCTFSQRRPLSGAKSTLTSNGWGTFRLACSQAYETKPSASRRWHRGSWAIGRQPHPRGNWFVQTIGKRRRRVRTVNPRGEAPAGIQPMPDRARAHGGARERSHA